MRTSIADPESEMNPLRFVLLCLTALSSLPALAHSRAGTDGTPPQYTVTAVAVEHGSATPPSQLVNEGVSATVTITPDVGYVLAGVDGGACGATDNGDGSWTTDGIFADCTITATFVLSADDVMFLGDFDSDIVSVDALDLDIDHAILGSSVNWLTGATCHACSEPDYQLRAASSFPVQAHTYLVFRFPINLPEDAYGLVTDVPGEDGVSTPLQSGATIGPAQAFGFPVSIGSSAAWRSLDGVDGYLGFRFLNTATGRINYGYAHLVTGASATSPASGFPATITGYSYNQRGDAIVIP
jgi:hypothetical protein